jgi:2-dehydropantoate 2-reductase
VRIAILGAGATGGFLGARLAKAGADVVLIARGPHLVAMRESGLRLIEADGETTVRVEATDDLAAIRSSEFVVVTLKAHSVPAMAEGLAANLGAGTSVVSAQNGIPWWYFQSLPQPAGAAGLTGLESVDPGGVIAASISPDHNIGCVVYCSTEIVEPGVIRHVEGTRFTIGEPDGSDSPRVRAISRAFAAGGLRAPVDPRLRDQIWLKLVGNVAFNPITALTGATLGQLGTLPAMNDLLRALFAESAAVAARLGVTFPVSLDRRLEAGIAVGDHKTSMLQDLEAGKRLELECMTGAIVELAARLGVDVPHTSTVHACVQLLDRLRAERADHG